MCRHAGPDNILGILGITVEQRGYHEMILEDIENRKHIKTRPNVEGTYEG